MRKKVTKSADAQPKRVPALKKGQYSVGHPLDDLQYLDANAYTGQSTNVSRLNVSGLGGEQMRTATVGNDHYADVSGNVYRNTGNGWEQHSSSGGWNHVSGENLESEEHARSMGEMRSSASAWGGGGGLRGGGGRRR